MDDWIDECRLTMGEVGRAQIWHEGKHTYLGLFESEIAAALAYNAKARELFGEFAYLNVL